MRTQRGSSCPILAIYGTRISSLGCGDFPSRSFHLLFVIQFWGFGYSFLFVVAVAVF